MNSDFEPLDRATAARAIALALELIPTNPDRAEYLLDQLLHRLMIDEALEHRSEVVEWYGPEVATQ